MTPFGTYILETLVTLVAIIALSIIVLVGARRFGIGRALGPIEMVGRLPLEGRRSVYLVRVLNRIFVLGASEAGLDKLAEFDSAELPADSSGQGFRGALARAIERKQAPVTNTSEGEAHAPR